jgi:dienelactone hydrolase
MPDFYEPEPPFPAEEFPPKTPEAKAELQSFFGTTANPSKAIEKLVTFGNDLKKEGRKRIGVYGICWGALAFNPELPS